MPKSTIAWPHAPPHRLTAGGAYFVTAGTYEKEHHFRSRERLEVVHRGLLKTLHEGGWQLEAWAVFSNHYHFVASTPAPDNLGLLLKTFHSKLSTWVNRLDATPGRKVWHNFRETHLTYEESYLARLNYTHQNAVRHGIVHTARDYPWCSARWFEEVVTPARVQTVYAFKHDQIKVDDDYPVAPDW
ncbi:transposase [Prosthecobacter sp.]|uniref:transposase n=1 Tax=Prosthecobacter sp. TaxID=1965333 RepID=UPI003782D572